MKKYIIFNEITLKKDVGQRLDHFLVKKLPNFSRSCIKKWILKNKIIINNNIVTNPSKKMKQGMEVEIKNQLETYNYLVPQNIKLNIIYEDNDILIINKSSNLVVHPGAGNLDGTILNALLYHYPNSYSLPRAGIVHRLDKDTTGLMIIAKNLFSQLNLIKKIKLREIIREYEALVVGNIKNNGIVNEPIARHIKKRTIMSVNPLGKNAITKYFIVENFNHYTHLRLRIETGRTHQIRVHMSHIKHPLVGDKLYGKNFNSLNNLQHDFIKNFNRQALHACMLEFKHPITGVAIKFRSSLPNDMYDLKYKIKNLI